MNVADILGIVGAASGIASLGTLIWFGGVWKGSVETRLEQLCDNEKYHPLAEIHMMCKTLWDVVVLDPLHGKPELAEKKSPWRLKEKGLELIPQDIRSELDSVAQCEPSVEDVSNGWLVVKSLGLPRIETMATNKNLLVQEAIAVLSAYVDEKITSCHASNGNNPV